MREIVLVNGRGVTLVDDEDFESLSRFRWRMSSGYAVGRPDGHRLTIALHRFLVMPPRGLTVDHANHDTLDNRRANLRICTISQNGAHRRIRRVGISGFSGVRLEPGGWVATCARRRLGFFGTAEEAARAFDRAAIERYGEFASLNFPTETAA